MLLHLRVPSLPALNVALIHKQGKLTLWKLSANTAGNPFHHIRQQWFKYPAGVTIVKRQKSASGKRKSSGTIQTIVEIRLPRRNPGEGEIRII